MSGWVVLPLHFLALIGGVVSFIFLVKDGFVPALLVFAILTFVLCIITLFGYFTIQPNESRVLILFGGYKGTERRSGFHWTNPFFTKEKVSLRAHNLNGHTLKVNDKRGNPIEIAAVVVWRVNDTAQASFDVEDYQDYVKVQSESAVRHLARSYFYDHGEDHEETEITLRSGGVEVIETLRVELQERLGRAGVSVEEARITHLAYAPEIASAMLRRQQAEAIIAARKKIVKGAVSRVHMALQGLAEERIVEMDDERKAAMVSNLLVILCGDKDASPIVNTGTLYT
ncbi:MAG TPA: SPFH domain-containing protein [Verrucomicrobiales bacterium]|nr:SPFH domain-containing protein [Verrucomicrobiales bacterium]